MIPKGSGNVVELCQHTVERFYSSLDALCEDKELSGEEVKKKLASIDYEYDAEKNQFV